MLVQVIGSDLLYSHARQMASWSMSNHSNISTKSTVFRDEWGSWLIQIMDKFLLICCS